MLHSLRALLTLSALVLGLSVQATAATFTIHSNSFGSNAKSTAGGYTVQITVTPVAIIAPASCEWGYGYNLEYNYEIVYSGNLPSNASLYTLQVTFGCGNDQLGSYNLPTKISATPLTGTLTTTTNPYTSKTDCATATLASMGCLSGNTTLNIDGPDMNAQTFSRPTNTTPLPVTLVSFDARRTPQGVSFAWTTANEETGDHYFLERSTDAVHWNALTVVYASNQSNYQYTDKEPTPGMNHYRLRNVDAKGVVTYSRVIGLKVEERRDAAAAQIQIFPNPINGEKLRISGIQSPADWKLAITNAAGQPFLNQPLTDAEINLPGMPAGLYFVRLVNSNTGESKIIKLVCE